MWAAYQPKCADDLADSVLDLSGNAHHAILPGAPYNPTWNEDDGWIFDGANDYLRTTFVPNKNQAQTVLVQYTDASDYYNPYGFFFGCYDDINSAWVGLYWEPTQLGYANGKDLLTKTPGMTSGNMALAGTRAYRNGVDEGITLNTQANNLIRPAYIGAAYYGGPNVYARVKIQALVIYTGILTPSQVQKVSTAMGAIVCPAFVWPIIGSDGIHSLVFGRRIING